MSNRQDDSEIWSVISHNAPFWNIFSTQGLAQARGIRTRRRMLFQRGLKLGASKSLYFLSKVQSFGEKGPTENVPLAHPAAPGAEVSPEGAANPASIATILVGERTAS
jgi:hypothetical protein